MCGKAPQESSRQYQTNSRLDKHNCRRRNRMEFNLSHDTTLVFRREHDGDIYISLIDRNTRALMFSRRFAEYEINKVKKFFDLQRSSN